MIILGIPSSLNDVMEVKLTETMTTPLAETGERTLSLAAEPAIETLTEWGDVLALGPGLSRNSETQELVRKILRKTHKPTVIDADGLNACADHSDCLRDCRAELILTPHIGELSRLIDQPIADIEGSMVEVARQTAADLGVVLVLKGAPTLVADPTGTVFINATGNAGMATAGCGDVLTGMIAGLLAQKLTGIEAAKAGVFLHGLAGDIGAQAKGQWGLVAGDIAAAVPEAILTVSQTGSH